MKKILILGGVSYDSIIHVNELPKGNSETIFPNSFHETIGSTGSGKALNLVKLGFQTTLHSIIGKDHYGKLIQDYFKNTPIQFIYDEVNLTERHTNIMDKGGNRISYFTVPPIFNPEIQKDRLEEHIKNHDIIILNILNYTKQLIPIIKKYKKEIWTDLHDFDGNNPYHKEFLEASDYVFLSSEKMPNYQSFMTSLIDQGKKLVVCTHGKAGATAIDNTKTFYPIPILSSFNVVDTNGAGDSFFSGFLYGYLRNQPIEECLQYGNISASLCVTSKELVHESLSEPLLLELKKTYYKK